MTSTATMTVEGMSCTGCSGKLKRALEAVEGVSEADVVLEGGNVTVHYDPERTGPAEFAQVVEDTGFDLVD